MDFRGTEEPQRMTPILHDWEWWSRFLQMEYYASEAERGTWKRTVRTVISDLNLSPGERVLDLGSGSGELVIGLAEGGIDAVGLDLYGALVEESRQKAAGRGVAASFVAADMFSWSPDERFDAITSINTSFGYGTDEQNRQLISQVGGWLRLGGRFYLDLLVADEAEAFGLWKDELAGGILQVENDWDEENRLMISLPWWIDGESGAIHTAAAPETVRIYTIAEIDEMLREAGFRFRRLKRGAGRRSRNESGPNSTATWLALKE